MPNPLPLIRLLPALLLALLFCCPRSSAEEPSRVEVELNRLEDQGGNCRAYFVFANPGATVYAGFKLDLIVFDKAGVITRRLAVEAAPLRAAKTTVKLFDIPGTPCNTVGSLLINDMIGCRDASGEVADCIDRLTLRSKLDVALSK